MIPSTAPTRLVWRIRAGGMAHNGRTKTLGETVRAGAMTTDGVRRAQSGEQMMTLMQCGGLMKIPLQDGAMAIQLHLLGVVAVPRIVSTLLGTL